MTPKETRNTVKVLEAEIESLHRLYNYLMKPEHLENSDNKERDINDADKYMKEISTIRHCITMMTNVKFRKEIAKIYEVTLEQ